MNLLALHLMSGSVIESIPNLGYWLFQAIGAICLFGIFLPVSVWAKARQREREAYYKAETLRRLAESHTESALATIELLTAEEKLRAHKAYEGMKIGGVVCIGAGLAVGIFLYAIVPHDTPVYFAGLIPMLVGAALLTYVFMLAKPLD